VVHMAQTDLIGKRVESEGAQGKAKCSTYMMHLVAGTKYHGLCELAKRLDLRLGPYELHDLYRGLALRDLGSFCSKRYRNQCCCR
jgi:hypothetical protein